MVECDLPKVETRVRFSLPAQNLYKRKQRRLCAVQRTRPSHDAVAVIPPKERKHVYAEGWVLLNLTY